MTTTTITAGTAPTTKTRDFKIDTSDRAPGYNLAQKMGRRLWLPMFVMALMGWTVGFGLSLVEASTSRSAADDLQTLSHLIPAFMFIGFMGVFSAITFAIARILGEFRAGGGAVQEAAGSKVQTLKMPTTAKIMLVSMMMGMMIMGAGIVTNFVAAAQFSGTEAADILSSVRYAAVGSGLRRMGTVIYLVGITFGLATISEVLSFQTSRVRQVATGRTG